MQIKRSAERSSNNIVHISIVIIGHYNSNKYKIEQMKVVYLKCELSTFTSRDQNSLNLI